jgi:hypothetical protein
VFFHHSNPSAAIISRLITPQTESTLFPCFSPSVTKKTKKKQTESTAASLFFSFGYVKKTETKKKKTKEKVYGCFIPVVLKHNLR